MPRIIPDLTEVNYDILAQLITKSNPAINSKIADSGGLNDGIWPKNNLYLLKVMIVVIWAVSYQTGLVSSDSGVVTFWVWQAYDDPM